MKVNKLDMKDFSDSGKKSSTSASQSMINLDDEEIQVTATIKNSIKTGLSTVKKQLGNNSILIDEDAVEASSTVVKKLDKTEIKLEGKVDNTTNVKEKLGGTKQKKITDFFKKKN